MSATNVFEASDVNSSTTQSTNQGEPLGSSKTSGLLLIDLPTDVIVQIIALLKQEEISRLSRSCRVFHDTLLPELLRRPSHISEKHVPSFLACLQPSTRQNRAHLLKTCSLDAAPPQLVANACSIIFQANNLTSLTLKHLQLAERFSEVVGAALEQLVCLEHLHLAGVTSAFAEVLSGVTLSLRSLCLYFVRVSELDAAPYDPLYMLRKHAPHLQELVLSAVAVDDRGDVPIFSRVRKLTIKSFHLIHGIGTLIHLFPAIDKLWLGYQGRRHPSFPEWEKEDNIAWQMKHGSWPHGLRYVHAEALTIVNGLQPLCAITRLDACSYLFLGLSFLAVTNLVNAMRPRCLRYSIADTDYHIFKGLVTRLSTTSHLVLRCTKPMMLEAGDHHLYVLRKVFAALKDGNISHLLLQTKIPRSPASGSDDGVLAALHSAWRVIVQEVEVLVEEDDLPPTLQAIYVDAPGWELRTWIRERSRGPWVELDEKQGRAALEAESLFMLSWRD